MVLTALMTTAEPVTSYFTQQELSEIDRFRELAENKSMIDEY